MGCYPGCFYYTDSCFRTDCKMTSKNDITGQKQQTKPASDTYRDNYDRIFGTKVPQDAECKPVEKKNDLPTGR